MHLLIKILNSVNFTKDWNLTKIANFAQKLRFWILAYIANFTKSANFSEFWKILKICQKAEVWIHWQKNCPNILQNNPKFAINFCTCLEWHNFTFNWSWLEIYWNWSPVESIYGIGLHNDSNLGFKMILDSNLTSILISISWTLKGANFIPRGQCFYQNYWIKFTTHLNNWSMII